MFQTIINFFYIFLYQPLFNLLVFLYNYIPGHDFGLAIIIVTLIIRFILLPTSIKATKSQKSLQKIQPQLIEIQKKYKDDKEKQAKEMLNFYKREKINPFSGLFLAIIQIPILIALYKVFWDGLDPKTLLSLYSFIANPGNINPFFFGMIDLAKPNIVLAVLAGIAQFYQTKMILPGKNIENAKTTGQLDMAQIMQKQMVYFFPVFTVIVLLGLPSALGLYWTASSAFSIIQQHFSLKEK